MTDRELLELAAKAVGLEVEMQTEDGIGWFACGRDEHGNVLSRWNPLTDDGDALRMSVLKGLLIEVNWMAFTATVVISEAYQVTEIVHVEKFKVGGPNIYSATRRAIVRAAAEIGKSMQGE